MLGCRHLLVEQVVDGGINGHPIGQSIARAHVHGGEGVVTIGDRVAVLVVCFRLAVGPDPCALVDLGAVVVDQCPALQTIDGRALVKAQAGHVTGCPGQRQSVVAARQLFGIGVGIGCPQ